MQLIRCTGKLQKEMGLKQSDLLQGDPDLSRLGPWHANLIYIDRRKCVLFVNDKTLFNFLVPNVWRKEIRDLDELFRNNLQCVLGEERFSASAAQMILAEYKEIGYAKTNNKSVLGSMNDIAFHYKYHIHEEGGAHTSAVPRLIKKLNRMPMGAITYAYPIEALRALYENET